MIDIIIPIIDKCEDLEKILLSILIQSVKDKLNVTLVSNKSLKKYKETIDYFLPKLPITCLEANDKTNVVDLKLFAVENSSNPYIMFIDENTHFYDAFSISSLYRQMLEENSEFIIGNVVNTREGNYFNTFNIYNDSNTKIFKRSFLTENKFNTNGEESFIISIFMLNKKYSYSDTITLVNIKETELLDKKTIKNIIKSIQELPLGNNSLIRDYIKNIIRNTTDKWLNSNSNYSSILKELETLYDTYK